MWPELEDELSAARELTSRSRPGDAHPRFRAILDWLRTVDLAALGPADHDRWSEGTVRGLVGEAVAVNALDDTLDKPLALLEDADARADAASPRTGRA